MSDAIIDADTRDAREPIGELGRRPCPITVQNLLSDGIKLRGRYARCDMRAHSIARRRYGSAYALQPFNVLLVVDRHRLLSVWRRWPFYPITDRAASLSQLLFGFLIR